MLQHKIDQVLSWLSENWPIPVVILLAVFLIVNYRLNKSSEEEIW